MAVQLSDVSNALHKVILPYVQDNFPKQTILLDQVKRNANTTFINNTFYAPVRTSRHSGITNLANDGSKLVTGKSSIGQASVNVKILTGTFDISKLTLEATKSTKGAVENMLTFQAQTLASDFSRNVNRQAFGDSYGIVAEVAGSTSATALTIRNPSSALDDTRSVDNYGSVNGDINPNKYLVAGQIIGIGSAAANKGTISSVSGTTVNLTGSTPSATGSAIYILDGDGGGAGTSELTGIRAALSSSTGTSTYAALARSNTAWTPQFGSVSESLTLSRIENSYLAAKEFGQMGDKYAIFVNRTLYKKYGDILTSLRRTVNATDLLGGWTGLEFAAGAGSVGMFLDYDVPDGECVIINLDTWTICQVSDLNWMEDPNSGSLFRRPDYLTYQATMVWFSEFLCLAPGANGRETQKTA